MLLTSSSSVGSWRILRVVLAFSSVFIGLCSLANSVDAETSKAPNPNYIFFDKGETIENWVWVLGDNKNWWTPLEGNQGKSASGKVTLSPSDYQGQGDAVKAKWKRGDTWGVLNIAGRHSDLAKFEHLAELIIIAKVDKKPKGDVKISMSCGDDCRGEISIKDQLRAAKTKEWFVLPVALDCFKAAGASKLEAINTPLSIGTNTPFTLHIASVHIQAMAKGDQGCVANPQ